MMWLVFCIRLLLLQMMMLPLPSLPLLLHADLFVDGEFFGAIRFYWVPCITNHDGHSFSWVSHNTLTHTLAHPNAYFCFCFHLFHFPSMPFWIEQMTNYQQDEWYELSYSTAESWPFIIIAKYKNGLERADGRGWNGKSTQLLIDVHHNDTCVACIHKHIQSRHRAANEAWFRTSRESTHTHAHTQAFARVFNVNFMLCTIQNANDNKTNKLTTKHNVMSTNSNRSCRSLSYTLSHFESSLPFYIPHSSPFALNPQFDATVRVLYGFMCRCRSSFGCWCCPPFVALSPSSSSSSS